MEGNNLKSLTCYYDRRDVAHLEKLNENFARLLDMVEKREAWVQDYVNRTMPIKSHIWILIASLSIVASFAAAMEVIQRITP